MAQLPLMTDWETMLNEYRTMGVHPDSHFMAYMRKNLADDTRSSRDLTHLKDGVKVTVAGLVIRRQHPGASAVFITLEDEFGHIPLILWPHVFNKFRLVIREPVLQAMGFISRRGGGFNVIVHHVKGVFVDDKLPPSKNWC